MARSTLLWTGSPVTLSTLVDLDTCAPSAGLSYPARVQLKLSYHYTPLNATYQTRLKKTQRASSGTFYCAYSQLSL